MSDLFGTILELFFSNRWVRHTVGGLVILGTLWTGDFSQSLPWLVLAVIIGGLVIHEFIDRHLKAKRQKQLDRHAPR